jgi:hypothetical protein
LTQEKGARIAVRPRGEYWTLGEVADDQVAIVLHHRELSVAHRAGSPQRAHANGVQDQVPIVLHVQMEGAQARTKRIAVIHPRVGVQKLLKNSHPGSFLTSTRVL